MDITWDTNPLIIEFSRGFGLRYYGLLFALAIFLGFFLFDWQIRRAGGAEEDAQAILLPGLLGTLIGARLGHVLFYNPGRLLADPLWVFQFWHGGLASHGALIGLLIAIWYYARHRGQSYVECLDRFTFSAAVAAVLVRFGNFFNSEIVGRANGRDWGVRFPRYDLLPPDQAPLRHPSQLYEAAMGLLILALLFWADRRLGREKRPRGVLAALFITTYFTGRFLVEFVKEYQVFSPEAPLTMGQILSLPVAVTGAVWLIYRLRHRQPAHWVVTRDKRRVGKTGAKG